ncbi:hypothetical protein R0131_03300 [Clostridium sp. AL.422]|uniref:hypothetical protein n=1 Tax=Clostridium TaxID=1485 RepID=UPI00293DFFF3|nr:MULTISPECIES: hypothetical protein [unclassified Clostridium]MDV4149852.1 hypothetical protein [Clostridium sp. AL.422]
MKKLAVLFPGMNYNSNKPLLYYIKKILIKEEFDIVEIEYGKLPNDKMRAFEIAITKANERIKDILWADYDEILFVSKSIGTVLGGKIASELKLPIRHIYLTPVNETLPFMSGDGIVFSGTADPMITTSLLVSKCDNNEIPLYLYEKCNHSIESGIIKEDLKILSEIIDKCEEYIVNM